MKTTLKAKTTLQSKNLLLNIHTARSRSNINLAIKIARYKLHFAFRSISDPALVHFISWWHERPKRTQSNRRRFGRVLPSNSLQKKYREQVST